MELLGAKRIYTRFCGQVKDREVRESLRMVSDRKLDYLFRPAIVCLHDALREVVDRGKMRSAAED